MLFSFDRFDDDAEFSGHKNIARLQLGYILPADVGGRFY